MSIFIPPRFSSGPAFPDPWPDSTQWVHEKTSSTFADSWQACDLSPDGTKIYAVQNQGKSQTAQWTMTTPWDIATMTSKVTVAAMAKLNCTGCRVKVDTGNDFYTMQDSTPDYAHQFGITNYNITGGTFTASFNLSGAGFSTTEDGLFIKADGTRLFYLSGSNVIQLTMTTPWSISTLGSKVTKAIIGAEDLFFHPSGLQMFTLSGSALRDYTMNPAWDISTLSLNASATLSGSRNDQKGLYIREDGLKLYTVRSINDTFEQYKKIGT